MTTPPRTLLPDAHEYVQLPCGGEIAIPMTRPAFKPWTEEFTGDTYGNKSILDVDGEPLFAELAIPRTFQEDGWDGVWVDTYRRKYRTSMDDGGTRVPPDMGRLLLGIYRRAGTRAGCFDVFCWKDGSVVFAESKRSGKDRIRTTQLRWIEAALNAGLPADSLLIVEWSLGSPNSPMPEGAPR